MLVFVMSCGAGGVPNEQGCADAANVKGVRVESAVAAAATFGVAIAVGCSVGIDEVGGVDKAVGVAVLLLQTVVLALMMQALSVIRLLLSEHRAGGGW